MGRPSEIIRLTRLLSSQGGSASSLVRLRLGPGFVLAVGVLGAHGQEGGGGGGGSQGGSGSGSGSEAGGRALIGVGEVRRRCCCRRHCSAPARSRGQTRSCALARRAPTILVVGARDEQVLAAAPAPAASAGAAAQVGLNADPRKGGPTGCQGPGLVSFGVAAWAHRWLRPAGVCVGGRPKGRRLCGVAGSRSAPCPPRLLCRSPAPTATLLPCSPRRGSCAAGHSAVSCLEAGGLGQPSIVVQQVLRWGRGRGERRWPPRGREGAGGRGPPEPPRREPGGALGLGAHLGSKRCPGGGW